jgi:hypothetical protein
MAIIGRSLSQPPLGNSFDELANITAADILHLSMAPVLEQVQIDLSFILAP